MGLFCRCPHAFCKRGDTVIAFVYLYCRIIRTLSSTISLLVFGGKYRKISPDSTCILYALKFQKYCRSIKAPQKSRQDVKYKRPPPESKIKYLSPIPPISDCVSYLISTLKTMALDYLFLHFLRGLQKDQRRQTSAASLLSRKYTANFPKGRASNNGGRTGKKFAKQGYAAKYPTKLFQGQLFSLPVFGYTM